MVPGMIVGQSCTAHKSRTTVSDLCPTLKVCLVGRGQNVEKWEKQTNKRNHLQCMLRNLEPSGVSVVFQQQLKKNI